MSMPLSKTADFCVVLWLRQFSILKMKTEAEREMVRERERDGEKEGERW